MNRQAADEQDNIASYKISAMNAAACAQHAVCSVDISIGNPNLTGEKLRALCAWAGKRFDTCLVSLGDTLYRHNLPEFSIDDPAATDEAQRMGDLWLHENAPILQAFGKPFTIVRWQDWLTLPEFGPLHEAMTRVFFLNSSFREAVAIDVQAFLERNAHNPGFTETGCRQYILEELSVHTLMARKYRLARLYPATRLRSAQYLARQSDSHELAGLGLETFIQINFKKRHAALANAA